MILYNFNLKLTGHQIKYLLRVCLRESDRIKTKYSEFPSYQKFESDTIYEITTQLHNEIIKIENELGVKI